MTQPSTQPTNVADKLALVLEWLNFQDESLSFGLRSAEDAIKLYDYWQSDAAEYLPEFCDACGHELAEARRAALGYDPLFPAPEGNPATRHCSFPPLVEY